jgi:ribonuclease P protein component
LPVRSNKLPPSERLKSERDIAWLFKTGNTISGGSFRLLWREADSFRFGVFVSRKLGGAVRRNRIKRRLREAVRVNRHLVNRPIHLGVVPFASAYTEKFAVINETMSRLLKQIGR